MKIQLEKGHGQLSFEVPEESITAVLSGKDVPGMSSETICEIIAQGLQNNLPENIVNKSVAVIIPDDTRLWARGDLFIPVIIKELLAHGYEQESIRVIIALGTHDDMEQERFSQLAGDFTVNNVPIFNSANRDSSRLVSFGKTSKGTELFFTKEAVEADHIIIFGGVLHHMLAGYGGGRKYIFPGVAGYDSIQQNHSLAMLPKGDAHPKVRQTELKGNPVHEDMQEAADIFLQGKSCTYVAIAANGQGAIFHAAVGPLKETFTTSCTKIDEACCLPIGEKGEFALISAGGYRTDEQLYQATKALFNCVAAVEEGGQILFVAGCKKGVGNTLFGDALAKYHNDPKALGRELVLSFNMPSYVAYRVIDLQKRFKITLVSNLSEKKTRDLGFTFVDNLGKYVNNLTGKGYVIPFAENILPFIEQAEEK